ncbi:MAG: AAA family ATPase [Clostridia bacterium]|nr:AAA family ATPase [Clostridia bacterium]
MERVVRTQKKTVLSSDRSAYMTESFLRRTKKILSIEALVGKIAEGIFFARIQKRGPESVMVKVFDGSISLFFRFGGDNPSTTERDLVFYKFLSTDKSDRTNDRHVSDFLEKNETFDCTLVEVSDVPVEGEENKLYRVRFDDKIHFPLLSPYQRSILQTEDKNILVQGVAGSGKTNLCIEKIAYCGCRGYRGRVLYTTFSRGLLLETKRRVNVIRNNVKRFVEEYVRGDVVFLDADHQKAVEKHLGVPLAFETDEYIAAELDRLVKFFDEQVDYYLIEDLYAVGHGRAKLADERTFLTEYATSGRSSGLFERVKGLSNEIVYKEIYGMIYGKYDPNSPSDMLDRSEYYDLRKDSFSRAECEAIYNIAVDYAKYLATKGYLDNNGLSRALLAETGDYRYTVGIVDETQDFTQVNLYLIRKLCLKLFCVGDAQQMINPSYFSFSYLKRLLYGEVTGVAELKHNYRNVKSVEKIVERIGDLNIKRFGTHSFVLRGQTVDDGTDCAAVYVEGDFMKELSKRRFEDLTIVVSSERKKELLRKSIKNVEILTVAEAKGLERNAVVLVDVLSDSADKWAYLTNMVLNRKTADENSVFRYYYNLFYVGVTRARRYLYVAEREKNEYFNDLFKSCFLTETPSVAAETLSKAVGKMELDDDELVERIKQFVASEQYENAYFTADRLSDEDLRTRERTKIYVEETFVRSGDYRGAGTEYWKRGYDELAKDMFRLSGDEEVLPLIDACRDGGRNLDYGVVRFFPLVADNPVAKDIVIETLRADAKEIGRSQRELLSALKSQRSKK